MEFVCDALRAGNDKKDIREFVFEKRKRKKERKELTENELLFHSYDERNNEIEEMKHKNIFR